MMIYIWNTLSIFMFDKDYKEMLEFARYFNIGVSRCEVEASREEKGIVGLDFRTLLNKMEVLGLVVVNVGRTSNEVNFNYMGKVSNGVNELERVYGKLVGERGGRI